MAEKVSSGKTIPSMTMGTSDNDGINSIIKEAQDKAAAMDDPSKTKQRTNISFDGDVHKALRLLALEENSSLTELTNKYCREALVKLGHLKA